jgi:hypothetical protein
VIPPHFGWLPPVAFVAVIAGGLAVSEARQWLRGRRRDDRPLQHPAFPFPDRGFMYGGVDSEWDPCGRGPIKNGKRS